MKYIYCIYCFDKKKTGFEKMYADLEYICLYVKKNKYIYIAYVKDYGLCSTPFLCNTCQNTHITQSSSNGR